MATINPHKNKDGQITGYYVKICVGRDSRYKQIQLTKKFPRPVGLTPAKERKEIQRLADAWELEKKAEYERNRQINDRDKITFAAFVSDHWIPDHVNDGSHTPNGVAFFKDTSSKLVEYFGPKKKLSSITTEDCKRYIGWLRTTAKKPNGQPYRQSTIKHQYDTLRNILKYAERMDYIDRDPTMKLSEKEKPKVDTDQIDFLAPEEARRFMACLQTEPIFWQALMSILITCGLRRGEVVGLQWQDIDTKNLTITVQRGVSMDKQDSSKIHIGKTKSKKSRTVPLLPSVYALLELLKAEKYFPGEVVLPTSYIFHTPDDPYKPLYPTHVTRWQSRFTKRHHLRNVSPHDLRHTAGTLALEGGASLKQVQELLGHSNPATTMKYYAGVTEEAKRRTVEGIEAILTNQEAT